MEKCMAEENKSHHTFSSLVNTEMMSNCMEKCPPISSIMKDSSKIMSFKGMAN